MPELRIILLVVGVLFIAGIAGFEWWRSRGARPLRRERRARDDSPADTPPRASDEAAARDQRGARLARGRSRIRCRSSSSPAPLNPGRGARSASRFPTKSPWTSRTTAASRESRAARARRALHRPGRRISEVRVFEEQPVRGPQLVLAWPNENERRIVTLRVIPQSEPRFQGRALRQAFSAAGFWHGPLDIYHLPDEGGRVVRAAPRRLRSPARSIRRSWIRSGSPGLNLFAVLPGPKPERETFDELVHAARQLAERLDGMMADQHGEELTPQRISRLRQALEAPADRARVRRGVS